MFRRISDDERLHVREKRLAFGVSDIDQVFEPAVKRRAVVDVAAVSFRNRLPCSNMSYAKCIGAF